MAREVDFKDSVRQQIINHLCERFRNISAGEDDYRIGWDVVSTVPLSKEETRQGFAIGIYDTSENNQDEIGYQQKIMNVVFEFHADTLEGISGDKYARLLLAEIERAIGSDIQMGGLAVDAQEQGNELDVEGVNDKVVSGVVIYQVRYRHVVGDPYRSC